MIQFPLSFPEAMTMGASTPPSWQLRSERSSSGDEPGCQVPVPLVDEIEQAVP